MRFLAIFLALVVLALPVLAFQGCKPVESPARARAAVSLVAEGVLVADKLCASVARDTKNVELARACMIGYDVARPGLTLAEELLDRGQTKSAACMLATVLDGLHKMTDALAAARVNTPPIVLDAFSFGPLFASQCK